MPKTITFDFHNTLIACDPWFEIEVRTLCGRFLCWREGGDAGSALAGEADRRYRALRGAIAAHGHELTAEQCVEVVLDQLGIRHDRDETASGVDAIMAETLDHARPLPGAFALVHELAGDGHKLGIVSSAVHHRFLVDALARFNMTDPFSAVTTSASSGYYKSRPEIYWRACRELGAAPRNVIHVGDSYKFDVLGGKRAGLATVWLSDDPLAFNKSPGPNAIIATLENAGPAILDASGA